MEFQKHKLFLRLSRKLSATPAVLQLAGVMLATLLFSLAAKTVLKFMSTSHVRQLHGSRWRVFSIVGHTKITGMCVHKENYLLLRMYQYSILIIQFYGYILAVIKKVWAVGCLLL